MVNLSLTFLALSSAQAVNHHTAPEVPQHFCKDLTITNALRPEFNGHYVDITNDDTALSHESRAFVREGWPIYGKVQTGSGAISEFIYPAVLHNTGFDSLHYIFDHDSNPKNGFFGGNEIHSCDSQPTNTGKGVEMWRKDLSAGDTKMFHWNKDIVIQCSEVVSNPNCGAPEATGSPTRFPTHKPTHKPTPSPTPQDDDTPQDNLDVGASIPAPIPAPAKKATLGGGYIALIVFACLAFMMFLFFAFTKRKAEQADEDTPVAAGGSA